MSINYRDMTRQFLTGKVEDAQSDSAETEPQVLSEGLSDMQSLATPQFAAAIKGEDITEARADGTISDDEDDLEDELMYETIQDLKGLITRVQLQSEQIGGPFRGPGIRKRILKAMAEELHGTR